MDRLIEEKAVESKEKIVTEEETVVENEKVEEKEEKIVVQPDPPYSYVYSFENITIGDIRKEEEKKKAEQFKQEKQELLKEQFKETPPQEPQQDKSDKIIEKPNYDLLEDNKKIVKLTKQEKQKKVKKKKLAGLAIACALGASAIICVTNAVIIDNMNANYIQIDETYKFNLSKYLRDIYNLDTTKKSMELFDW